ncbi:MAG: MBL fold metallo-hydrolase [Pseudomonadota bacterium]
MTHDTKPLIRAFFDEATFTASYLVIDPATREAAIIDSVLDYDPRSGKVSTTNADKLLAAVVKENATVRWILETHAHADHLTAAQYLKTKTAAKLGIGARITDVQTIFEPIFDLDTAAKKGSEFDHWFADGEKFKIGNLTVEVMATPGHTPACVSYKIGDAVFVGDTLFMPDYGTARADFPGGDAHMLYRSIQRLLTLPDETRLFLCHDYKAPGRNEFVWETNVGDERQHNVHIRQGVTETEFVTMRQARDATLAAPVLLLPSIQVNIHAGHLPKASENGQRYLKIPLTLDKQIGAAL